MEMSLLRPRSLALQQVGLPVARIAGSVSTMVSATTRPKIYTNGIAVLTSLGALQAVHQIYVLTVRMNFTANLAVR